MRRVYPDASWPDSWAYSYPYDLEEVYGEISNYGYAYAYKNRRTRTLRMITEVLKPGSKILDIAAAQGNFSIALAELGYDVTWNDLRSDLEGYVRAKHSQGMLTCAAGNAFDLNFPSKFDCVLITEVIEHVAHPDDFLRKAAELVVPGGYIVMTTPNGKYFRNRLPKFSDCKDPSVFESIQFGPNSDGHIFLLHENEVRDFATANNMTIDRIELFTNPLTAGHVKLGLLLRWLPVSIVNTGERLTTILPAAISSKLHSHMAARFQTKS